MDQGAKMGSGSRYCLRVEQGDVKDTNVIQLLTSIVQGISPVTHIPVRMQIPHKRQNTMSLISTSNHRISSAPKTVIRLPSFFAFPTPRVPLFKPVPKALSLISRRSISSTLSIYIYTAFIPVSVPFNLFF